MAKKKSLNKSQLIRDFAAAHPEAKGTEIAEALTKQHGVEFKANAVNTTLWNAKNKAGKKPVKRGPKPKLSKATILGHAETVEREDSVVGYVKIAKFLLKGLGLQDASALLLELHEAKDE